MSNRIKTIAAGEFKAKCLQLMDQVKEQQMSITITKHGVPVAKLVPAHEEPKDLFGLLQDSVTIEGDIIAPVDETWSADED